MKSVTLLFLIIIIIANITLCTAPTTSKTAAAPIKDNVYCGITCPPLNKARHHTICMYGPVCQTAGPCQKYKQKPLTEEEKDYILKLHNDYRLKISKGEAQKLSAYKASNMKEIVWDAELEKIANCWALQCQFKHDECRNTAKGLWVGQNLAMVGTNLDMDSLQNNNTLDELVAGWYNEIDNFDPSNIEGYKIPSGPPSGHFTQLVWGETNKIGCSRVCFKRDPFYKCHLVCNYAPAGNIVGRPMFKPGTPGSNCEAAKSIKYPGLCASG